MLEPSFRNEANEKQALGYPETLFGGVRLYVVHVGVDSLPVPVQYCARGLRYRYRRARVDVGTIFPERS
jgi:hypothetical protein